ncbi:hypothetical protein JYU34_002446 [Plutella xylostella]|uniref:Uncharacterized protein n=1 Tax=Plutella xylostella TaxID=51655 RepID=A0ABQ7R280_PLUXY|nr:hypothetical protein JYU34_002446 [Plutella xylostella]
MLNQASAISLHGVKIKLYGACNLVLVRVAGTGTLVYFRQLGSGYRGDNGSWMLGSWQESAVARRRGRRRDAGGCGGASPVRRLLPPAPPPPCHVVWTSTP